MTGAFFGVLFMGLNLILYFMFGALFMPSGKREPSLTRTVFTGFFFYYLLFTVVCIPVTLRWRPLHVLTRLWLGAVILVILIAAVRLVIIRNRLITCIKKAFMRSGRDMALMLLVAVMVMAFMAIVLFNYQFTLDASFYVGNVTTSITTDTLNIYDPFTGNWLDHFEMRYFFATFPMNDAVFCDLLGIHPLIWCKITMSGTALVLSAMVLYMISVRLFDNDMKKTAIFMFFSLLADFYMITIYTTAAFITTRTYEGKALLGNVVLPGIIYIYMLLLDDVDDMANWMLLLLLALGSPVLSSSANMLVPAMIGVTILPLCIIRKNIKVIPRSLICMMPGVALTLMYVAYVKGMFVFYTYPR